MPKIIQNGVEYSTVPSTLSTLSDTDINSSTIVNGQFLKYADGNWVNSYISDRNIAVTSTCSIARGSTMASTFPLPSITRRGSIVVVTFGMQLPTGTYTTTDTLWVCTPKPIALFRGNVAMGASFPSTLIDANGNIRFNGTQTLSSDTWFIGQMFYLTDG